MNLLILGGTVFLGRHLVDAGVAAGHKVTTFNRGNNRLPEQADIEQITGDRGQNLDRLAGRKWDAVIDTCGYTPDVVAASCEALKDAVETYVFMSSISAYQDFRSIGMDETAPLRVKPEGGEDDYGSLKAACEKEVARVLGDRGVSIRAGLIVGPYDSTDRFTYWPTRVGKGGKVLAPGDPESQLQFIDVRDLSQWIVKLIAAGTTHGTDRHIAYNATGPDYGLSMKHFLEECKAATGSDAEFVWMSDTELESAKVESFSEMPLWIPQSNEDFRGFMKVDCTKAHLKGLTYRRLADTIRDTRAWDAARGASAPRKAGLSSQREEELLACRPAS